MHELTYNDELELIIGKRSKRDTYFQDGYAL